MAIVWHSRTKPAPLIPASLALVEDMIAKGDRTRDVEGIRWCVAPDGKSGWFMVAWDEVPKLRARISRVTMEVELPQDFARIINRDRLLSNLRGACPAVFNEGIFQDGERVPWLTYTVDHGDPMANATFAGAYISGLATKV